MDRPAIAAATGRRVVVIGAGIGGLSAALRLSAAGCEVTVVEAAPTPGGKMRTVPSAAGPVDAGPTVLTMRGVFDALCADAGTALDDHLRLIPLDCIARHWWPGTGPLDLFTDPARSAEAIGAFAGPQAVADFRRFDARTRLAYAAFDGPVMQSARLSPAALARAALVAPALWPMLAPGMTLARWLALQFRDPRLRQLFGRYATYVGGCPDASPAVLSLIWQAEAAGVWAVEGGMHRLAQVLADLARDRGAQFRHGARAVRIAEHWGHVSGVHLACGTQLPADHVVFNGDPAALAAGLLGPAAQAALPRGATQPRSLSARVWSFAAIPRGPDLAYHNVFFTPDPQAEFAPLRRGQAPEAASFYVCAQDRAAAPPPPGRAERFEIILNAPAGTAATPEEDRRCHAMMRDTLASHGLTFDPEPQLATMAAPADFARMFPGSGGAIYGLSPHGLTASFRRPAVATRLAGLWLCGGGVHPGAGVPMAARSGWNAAQGVLMAPASPSRSGRTAMPGGMSTGSPTAAPAPSRSSPS
ncbi:MAG: FAD-dependent oxidoreductase [Paracoccaceae bacterium]|nr:MAG: FAD-dependent oxidoreductase [Paracoccaceae bacterium]